MKEYVEHPLIKPGRIEKRLYQETMLAGAVRENTLVVLPTGLGKTALALLVCVERLSKNPNGKVLFLAPTKPLVEQQYEYFKNALALADDAFAILTGKNPPAERDGAWEKAQLFFCTPQVVENDVLKGSVRLSDFSLLIFDEAHRSMGDYAYTFIGKQYAKNEAGRILALTASPGGDEQTIKAVCNSLSIKNIEIRTEKDADVKPYAQDVEVVWETVLLPEDFKKIKETLEKTTQKYCVELRNAGHLKSASIQKIKMRDLLIAQGRLRGRIKEGDVTAFSAISKVASAIKASHALELLETQGTSALHNYFNRLALQKSKAVASLQSDDNFINAVHRTRWLCEKGIEHPKIERLHKLLKEQLARDPRAISIVFSQYRDSVSKIIEHLEKNRIRCGRLVGQNSITNKGMSQKEQGETIGRFKNREFSVLVASSVGEEGLDIPSVSTVYFFEPVPSGLRSIQRRGRTARHGAGKVVVLIAKDTRDEAYYWSAHHKERRMKNTLAQMKDGRIDLKQARLGEF